MVPGGRAAPPPPLLAAADPEWLLAAAAASRPSRLPAKASPSVSTSRARQLCTQPASQKCPPARAARAAAQIWWRPSTPSGTESEPTPHLAWPAVRGLAHQHHHLVLVGGQRVLKLLGGVHLGAEGAGKWVQAAGVSTQRWVAGSGVMRRGAGGRRVQVLPGSQGDAPGRGQRDLWCGPGGRGSNGGSAAAPALEAGAWRRRRRGYSPPPRGRRAPRRWGRSSWAAASGTRGTGPRPRAAGLLHEAGAPRLGPRPGAAGCGPGGPGRCRRPGSATAHAP